jgi:septin 2
MKLLHKKVNIIPLIAKADTLTRQEVSEMKKRILQDIAANEITVYTVPDCDPDEDHDFKQQITELKAAIPFAVSSSTESHEVKGKSVLGRAYPWGIFETENPDHSDFVKLRSLLVTHMQDLREVTQEVHYENYRSQRIVNNSGNLHNASFDTTLDNAGDNYESDRKLKEKEAEIKRMQLQMAEMQAQLKQQQQPAPHHANGVENGSNGHSK